MADLSYCAWNPTDPSCIQLLKNQLGALRTNAENEIKGLKANAWYGPVLADALRGARNPAEVAQRAQQLAGSFSSDGLKQDAYKFFYGQARAGIELVDDTLSIYPEVRALKTAGVELSHLAYEGKSIFQTYEKEGIDSSGVAATLNLTRKAVGVAQTLARSLGAAPGSAANDALDWVGIAAGCGAAIATGAVAGMGVGAIGGAVACGVGVLAKILGLMSINPPPTVNRKEVVAAKFAPNGKEQVGVIAADAARLATVLKYHYHVPSWGLLIGSNRAGPYLSWANDPLNFQLKDNYAPSASRQAAGFTTLAVNELFTSYFNDGFTTSTPALGRSFWGDYNVREMMQQAYKVVAGAGPSQVGFSSEWMPVSLAWAELVSFFAGVTLHELNTAPGQALAPWKAGLPLRFWHGGHGAGGDYPVDRTTRYDLDIWSRGDISTGRLGNLLDAVAVRDNNALLEFGNLRLLSALSYMQMAFHWGTGSVPARWLEGNDMIDSLETVSPNMPGAELRVPVNPRRGKWGGKIPMPGQIQGKVKNINTLLSTIAAAARYQAEQDAIGKKAQLSGKSAAAYIEQTQAAAGASFAQLMQQGLTAGEIALKTGQIEYRPHVWTAAEKAAWAAPAKAPETANGGVGVPVAIFTAGFLLLKLLK